MNKLTHPTYIKARDLILKSEGDADLFDEDDVCFRCEGEGVYRHNYTNEKGKYVLRKVKCECGPIPLDRVLMALEKKSHENKNKPPVLFGCSDRDHKTPYIATPWGCFDWKLTQPLHLQTEEVWEKIVEILEDNQK